MRPHARLATLGLAVILGLLLTSASAGRMATGAAPQTVDDPLLGVTWLADADLASRDTFGVPGINADGSMDYETALAWVGAMNAADYLDHHDWMLPTTPSDDPGCQSHNVNSFGFDCTRSALGSLYYETFGLTEPDTAVSVLTGDSPPFTNLQPYFYWTRTRAVVASQGFRTFSFNTGWAGSNVGKHDMYVLPMLEGDPFDTSSGGGTGLQLSSNGDTVYDPAAGVTWLADADLARTQSFGLAGIDSDGSMTHSTAVRWIAALNKAAWLGKRGWQLPSVGAQCGGFNCTKENPLGELYYQGLGLHQGAPAAATPVTSRDGFQDLQPYLYWSCAAATVQGPCSGAPAQGFQWSFSFGNGFEGTDLVQNDLYVIVYYPSPSRPPRPPCRPPTAGTASTCR